MLGRLRRGGSFLEEMIRVQCMWIIEGWNQPCNLQFQGNVESVLHFEADQGNGEVLGRYGAGAGIDHLKFSFQGS